MNVEGQYNPKDVECIPVENLEVLPSGADWQSRHLESERRKAEIRDRIHKQTEQGQKTAKDYFRPAKPTPSIYDSDLKRVAVYARVSTSSEEQISSIENQTLYYTKKIAETENWNLYRSKWVQSITVNDVMESGQVVENPMIGAIPSRNEVQRELDDLLMSM